MKEVNEAADADDQTLRISMDAKATVKVGPFSRGGKSRVKVKAADHDFSGKNVPTVTPIGLFLPELDELFLYAVTRHPSPVIVWWSGSWSFGKGKKIAFLISRPWFSIWIMALRTTVTGRNSCNVL